MGARPERATDAGLCGDVQRAAPPPLRSSYARKSNAGIRPPFQGGFTLAEPPRAEALGCSVRPFHGPGKGRSSRVLERLLRPARLPLTSHFSLLTSHFSLHLSRHLLWAWLGAKFVGEEREDIGLVGDLLIQRTPDAMSE
jgi:hypothetical protein